MKLKEIKEWINKEEEYKEPIAIKALRAKMAFQKKIIRPIKDISSFSKEAIEKIKRQRETNKRIEKQAKEERNGFIL